LPGSLAGLKALNPGEYIEINGHEYLVDEGLLVIKLLKQRFDSGSGIWPIHFEPQTLTIKDYSTKAIRDVFHVR
jgi:hypothetical protein